MAENVQDFEGLLQAFLVDINGDGVPDAQIQAPAITNRDRGMIQRRAMAGREPGPLDQARLAADMPRLEQNSNALASTAAEFTGLPAIARGGERFVQGVSEGRPLQAAAGVGEAALGAMPFAGAARVAAPVMNALAGTVPRAMATTGALALPMGVADVQEAQAQSLTKRQTREIEMERLRREQEVAAERQRAMDQVAVDQARQQAEAAAKQEAEQRSRDAQKLPWRERNPEIAAALPAIGYGLAAGVPAMGGLVRNVGSWLPGSSASRMNRAANQGEALLTQSGKASAADTREVLLRRDQLTNQLNNQPSPTQEFITNRLAPAGAGGVLAYEGRVFPDQMDMRDVNLTPEQRQAALNNIFDGGGFGLNVLMGGLTGLSSQELVDRLIPRKTPDVEKATAVRDRLSRYRKAR